MEQYGGAGHSIEITKRLCENGKLIGIDRDEVALKASKEKLIAYKNVEYIHGNHDEMQKLLNDIGIQEVDGILLDLGISSYQIDTEERGFSYIKSQAPLDMRMDKTAEKSAKEVVNEYTEETLSEILDKYGEERFAKKIAKNICEVRKVKPIETTGELVEIIKKSIPLKFQNNGHPAKKTFQAIRIEVNNEIEPLYNTVISAINLLKPKGRLCIITFHSLEDRAVKMAYTKMRGNCICPKELPYCVCGAVSYGKIINKKPIIPSKEEREENLRSKSAKLRIFEKK